MAPEPKPLNILVVEDNPSDFVLFEEYLKRTGLSANPLMHANRMKEALKLLETNNPDLIFIDLALPDSDGIESFNSINRAAPNLSIIVLSGLADKQVALNTILLGAQDYLVKGSFDETLLAKSIEYSIERKKNLRNAVENYERYHSLVNATNDTVWDWDLRSDEVSWNDGIFTVFGHEMAGMLTTEEWHFQNIHPADQDRVVKNIQASIVAGMEHWTEEYRYLCHDGTYKSVYDRGYILLDEYRKPYRMIGVMMDVTDRKRRQEEKSRHALEKQKLVTQITIQTQEKERKEIGLELHDNINQILATARLYVKVALKEDEIEKELLYKSYDCITRAIKEIRFVSKSLILGSMKDIRLRESLREIADNMAAGSDLHIALNVQFDALEDMPLEIKLAVYRIVQEQVNNIVKHSKASHAAIELSSFDRSVCLVVKDNGIGIETGHRFSGIGLHNIASRVEMLNGKVEVITSAGKGFTLKVQLPLE